MNSRRSRSKRGVFLEAIAKRRRQTDNCSGWVHGSDAVGLLDTYDDRQAEADALVSARRWRRLVFDSGFGWLDGPKDLGGAGRSQSSTAACEFAVAEAIHRFGQLDHLVASAAISREAPAREVSDADWDAVVGTNLSVVFRIAHASLGRSLLAAEAGLSSAST